MIGQSILTSGVIVGQLDFLLSSLFLRLRRIDENLWLILCTEAQYLLLHKPDVVERLISIRKIMGSSPGFGAAGSLPSVYMDKWRVPCTGLAQIMRPWNQTGITNDITDKQFSQFSFRSSMSALLYHLHIRRKRICMKGQLLWTIMIKCSKSGLGWFWAYLWHWLTPRFDICRSHVLT